MRKICLLLALLLGTVGGLWHVGSALAARGSPGSAEFGYGARLLLDGPYLLDALDAAIDLPVDWLAITIPWQDFQTGGFDSAHWKTLDFVMQRAGQNGIAVIFSLTHAPINAQTSSGPDPQATAQYVRFLASRYPAALQAVEIFPAANTAAGWGAMPDPQAYLAVYQAVVAALQEDGSSVIPVAGGLQPVRLSSKEDWEDARFLEALYQAAGITEIPVVSLDLSRLSTESLSGQPGEESLSLRHYEQVRQVMIAADRRKDLIWITSFAPPSGKIEDAAKSPTRELQVNWLYQSYMQMRSQLYIGVTIFESLNPAADSASNTALILDNHEYYAFYPVLRKIIAQNVQDTAPRHQGRPKSEALSKHPP